MDSLCRYDLEGFADDLGLPIDDIADLFSDFIQEINSEISKVKTFLSEKNLTGIEQINHNIKGISVNYRILDIYEETMKISRALKNGDYAHIETLYDNFFNISDNAVKAIVYYFEQKGFVISPSLL